MAIKFRTAITPPSGNGTKNGRVYVALGKDGYSLPGDSTYHVHHDGKTFDTQTTRGIHLGNFRSVKSAISAIKRDANSRLKNLANPSVPKGKFIKCKAVKFNKNGSISIKK